MTEMIRFLKFEHNSIPDYLKSPLAQLFHDRHKEFSEMPTHQFSYYLSPLERKLESEICKSYILALKNDNLIGYASLEYRESQYNEVSGNLMVYVIKNERSHGVGIKLFRTLLPFPSQIRYIKVHAISNSRSSNIVKKIFNSNPVSTRKQNFMLVRNYEAHKLEMSISKLEKLLEKEEIEEISVTSENYHQISQEYAKILEYLWNKGSKHHELFPVERLHGRMEYFKSRGIVVHAILLKKASEFIGLYETVFYRTNNHVADESICGMKSDFSCINLLKLMKLKCLHFILNNTNVTHWESPIETDDRMLSKINKELGFVVGKSFDHFIIPIEIP